MLFFFSSRRRHTRWPRDWSSDVCSSDLYTPDGEFILGEATKVGGFFVAAGFCAHGIAGAGGVGKVIAAWILDGHPPMDLRRMDVGRFGPDGREPARAAADAIRVYATYYDLREVTAR